jgi:hypothetical protein
LSHEIIESQPYFYRFAGGRFACGTFRRRKHRTG